MRAWERALTAWSGAMRAAGRSEQTIGLRTYQVGRFARDVAPLGPWAVTLDDLLAWAGGQRWSRATLASYRAALRSFYAWAVSTGRCAENPAERLPAPGATPPRPHPAPELALRCALASAAPRERLMVRLAAELGMRRGEVARVRTDDVIADLGGWSLIVHGKGGRERVMPMSDGLAAELRRQPPGWVFPGDDHGHLSPRWVGKLVGRLLPDGYTMHSLRHRFATRAYGVDRDLLTVQSLLGHASPVTTRAYVLIDDDARRRTVAAVGAA